MDTMHELLLCIPCITDSASIDMIEVEENNDVLSLEVIIPVFVGVAFTTLVLITITGMYLKMKFKNFDFT